MRKMIVRDPEKSLFDTFHESLCQLIFQGDNH